MRNVVASVVLKSRDLASRGVRRFKDSVFSLKGAVAGLAASLTALVSGTAIVSFFKGAVTEAGSFEEQMAKVGAVTGATSEQMDRLRAAAIQMGESTTFNANEAGAAIEQLSRAGLDTTETLEALPQVLALARGNSLELANAAQITTRVVKGMGLSFEETGRVTDVLTAAAQNANTTVQGMGQAFSQTATTANSLGLSVEETSALIGTLADNGIDASRAGTALNAIFSQLQEEGSKFNEELEAAGITTDDFGEILQQLRAKGEDASAAISAVGREAGPALRALISESDGSLQGLIQALRDSGGAAQEAQEKMDNTLFAAIERLKSVWRTLTRTLGNRALPQVREAVEDLGKGIKDFIKSQEFDKFAEDFAQGLRNMIQAGRDFVTNFDIGRVISNTSGTLRTFTEQLQNIGNIVTIVTGSIRSAFNTVQIFVATVVANITEKFAFLADKVADTAETFRNFGLVSESMARRARGVAEGLDAAARSARENARANEQDLIRSANDTRDAFVDLIRTTEDKTEATDQDTQASRENSQATQEQIDKMWELSGAREAANQALLDAAEGEESATQQAREQSQEVERLRREYDELAASGTASAQQLGEKLKELEDATSDTKESTDDLTGAFEQLGIKSQAALEKAAQKNKEAFEQIRNDGTTAATDINNAFRVWAKSVVKAGDQSEIALARTKARALGLGDELEELGLKGKQAGEDIKEGAKEGSDELEKTKKSADEVSDSIGRTKEEAQKFRAALGNAFGKVFTRARKELNELSVAARNAFESKFGDFGKPVRDGAETTAEALERLRGETQSIREALQGPFGGVITDQLNEIALKSKNVQVQFFEQKQRLERLVDTYNRGGISLENLSRRADNASNRFSLLGDEDLEPLNSAIREAESRIKSLNSESKDTLQDLQDELLQLQGREDELADRRRQRRREEIRGELAQARATGADESVRNLQKALDTLDKISQEEREQRRQEREEQRRRERERQQRERQEQQRAQQQAEQQRRQQRPQRTVRVELNGAPVDVPEDQADRFLRELERTGARSQ